jgi:gliding motility-associated-like protein
MKLTALPFVLLFFICLRTSGAVFMVTSNADSGSGTLREALTLAAANGFATKDFIHFNLNGNSVLDRTITLNSELPLLSSNLVIDATIQPGMNLGISTTKVILKANRITYQASAYDMGGLNLIRVNDVAIYGICFDSFYDLRVSSNPNGQNTGSAAIYMLSSTLIQIGSPGKGNVFMENGAAIYASGVFGNPLSKQIKVQSNWFGLNTNGTTAATSRSSYVNLAGEDVEFGGPDVSYGNILGGYSPFWFSVYGNRAIVRFNSFGYNGDGSPQNSTVPITLNINNGIMSDNIGPRLRINVENSTNTKIIRNTETKADFLSEGNAIRVAYSNNIEIGSDQNSDMNTFLPLFGPFYNLGSTNVEIRKNIVHCASYTYIINGNIATTIQVLVNDATTYAGKASPGAEVYIYNDYTDCSSCSPLQFFDKQTADANGDWKITGDFSAKKFIANATLIKSSSEYTQPQILSGSSGYWFEKTDPTCGQANGKIELTRTLHLLKVEWYNLADQKVGEGSKIENLPVGRYYAKGFNGKCYTKTAIVDLFNVQPSFIDDNLKVQQPGCGQNNGSIKGLFFAVSGQASFKWVDANNNTIPSGNTELDNLGPGSYSLIVTTSGGCAKTYGPIVLQNTNGPNINEGSKTITEATCGTDDGAISGITATGTGNLQFVWKNDQGKTVAESAQLSGVPSGNYTLTITDQSSCGPLSATFTIPEKNGIAINMAAMSVIRPTCSGNNGGIIGITATGAASYKWIDEQNQTVSTDLILQGAKPGRYYLLVSNTTCSRATPAITIELQPNLIDIGGLTKIITNASCGLDNGSIQVSLQNPVSPPVSYRWTDQSGKTLNASGLLLTGLSEGTYHIFGIDGNNCEILLASYQLQRTPMLQIDQTSLALTADRCNRELGSITGLKVSGGTLPLSYKWTDEFGETKGTTINLQNIAEGIYNLQITDALGCRLTTSHKIINTREALERPILSDVQVCGPGMVTIAVNDAVQGSTYRLYDDGQVPTPLASSQNGNFKVGVEQSRNYYLSQLVGNCESPRTMVNVTIGLTALSISNAFSPNNDMINDNWQIKSIEHYPKALVQIFNRMGTKVFESVGYQTPFDGTMNGNILPNGVYYYLINFGSDCGMIKGSLTIIR